MKWRLVFDLPDSPEAFRMRDSVLHSILFIYCLAVMKKGADPSITIIHRSDDAIILETDDEHKPEFRKAHNLVMGRLLG